MKNQQTAIALKNWAHAITGDMQMQLQAKGREDWADLLGKNMQELSGWLQGEIDGMLPDAEAVQAGDTIGKPQHTPEPWTVNSKYEIYSAKGDIIAQIYDNPGEEQAEFNTCLIAAAPELLAACRMAVARLAVLQQGSALVSMLDRAIAKAEGKS